MAVEEEREIFRQKSVNLDIIHKLTAGEVLEFAKRLAGATEACDAEKIREADLKAHAKEAKSRHEALALDMTSYSNTVMYEQERRRTECSVHFDYEREIAFVINPVSGRVISARDLVDAEKQPELFPRNTMMDDDAPTQPEKVDAVENTFDID